CRSVLLPLPDSPVNARLSPSANSRSTPCNTGCLSWPVVNDFRTSCRINMWKAARAGSVRVETPIVVDCQRCMVAEPLLFVDARSLCRSGDGRGCNLVVDAPTHVIGACLSAVAPPCVGFARGLGVKPTIHVYPSQLIKHPCQPGPFFW